MTLARYIPIGPGTPICADCGTRLDEHTKATRICPVVHHRGARTDEELRRKIQDDAAARLNERDRIVAWMREVRALEERRSWQGFITDIAERIETGEYAEIG